MTLEREMTQDERSAARIAVQQNWLADAVAKIRGVPFYGELTIRLKFENGRCVLGEHVLVERFK